MENNNKNKIDVVNVIDEGKKVFEIEIDELKKVRNKVDENFEKLVNMIFNLGKNKVVITGIGKSGIIGEKIAATLASTGTSAIFVNSAEALHGDLGMISCGDIVIAISNSGNSDEVLSILEPIKKIGAKIVSLTGNKSSALAKHSEVVVNIGVDKEACPIGQAPTSSTTATLVMGDAIAASLMKLRNFSPQNFAMYHPGGSLGRKLLTKVGNLMKTGEALALCKADTSMEDIVILMSEKKLGVVCVMNDDNSLLVGIITEGDIRRALSHKEKFFSLKASDIMTTNYTKVDKEEMATQALSIMEDRPHQINVLPVFDDNNFVGVIRIHDLLKVR